MIAAAEYLGLKAQKSKKLDALLRRGLPYAALQRMLETTGMPRSEIAKALDISARTLGHHKGEGVLSAVESDKLYRFARIFALAVELTGSEEDAREWLMEPASALGGVTPVSLLATDFGTGRVEALIDNIMAGVP